MSTITISSRRKATSKTSEFALLLALCLFGLVVSAAVFVTQPMLAVAAFAY
jgi:hypothetical protein